MNKKYLRLFSAIIAAAYIFSCLLTCVYAEETPSAPVFTPEEQDYINSHSSVRVGYITDRIPICFQNDEGEADGISRLIFDRISSISGLDFEYTPLPVNDVTYDYLLDGGFDLVTSVEYNEENKNARGILISNPYLSSRKVIVAKDGMDFKYGADLTAAVSTGSQTLKKVLGRIFPTFELKDYESIPQCFDAVNSGDSDVLIQNQYVVEYWLSKPKYEKLHAIPIIGLDDDLCFSAVVSFDGQEGPSPENGQILIDILDKSIAAMSEDEVGSYIIQGVMDNQYQFEFSDFLSRYRYSVAIFIVAIIVIFILGIYVTRQRIRIAQSRTEAQAKSRFLSTMSHEIRTPLNGLIGLNFLMSINLNNNEKLEEYLKQSSITAKYLLSLVNDILDSSKLEARKMDLTSEPVDISLIINTVSSILGNAMQDKLISFSVSADLPFPYVLGDKVRIQQVILNLLDNARKFTSKGGIVQLSVSQTEKDGNILTSVVVRDTGKGMSEEFQKKVFDLFAQELDTVSKGNQGTGLGLSISRRLARLMGGDITCESVKGEGSLFTFTFTAPPCDPPEDENAEKSAGKDKKLPSILIAEDNELNSEILLELLHSEGFEAVLCDNGKKAFECFKNSAPGTFDVILMDLLMPEMNGFEAAKAIRDLDREDAKTVRIFACTANSFIEEKEKAYESGMNDFITKPIDIEVLLRKLKAR